MGRADRVDGRPLPDRLPFESQAGTRLMATIVMADDGIPFDGRTPETRPLGGAESAFVSLANALAGRGHSVTAYTSCLEPLDHKRVAWRPISGGLPDEAGLYIANRGYKLLRS